MKRGVKSCPLCGEKIHGLATRCKYCKSPLPEVPATEGTPDDEPTGSLPAVARKMRLRRILVLAALAVSFALCGTSAFLYKNSCDEFAKEQKFLAELSAQRKESDNVTAQKAHKLIEAREALAGEETARAQAESDLTRAREERSGAEEAMKQAQTALAEATAKLEGERRKLAQRTEQLELMLQKIK